MKKVDLFPFGPGAPNQAPPFFAYGSEPPGGVRLRRHEPRQRVPRDPADRRPAGIAAARARRARTGSSSRRPASSTTSACSTGLTWPGTSWSRREVASPAGAGSARASGPRRARSARRRGPRRRADGAGVREYWIAAVPVTWNVVPNGRNAIEGETFTPRGDDASRRSSTAATRRTGRARCGTTRRSSGDNDGIPGPLLRARVGDRILVHFKNLDNEFEHPHSMHFHGVEYAVGSDGAFLPGSPVRARTSSPASRSPTA